MAAQIIDGKKLAQQIKAELREEVERLKRERGITPGLAVILVGDDPASRTYVRNKERACRDIGIFSQVHRLPAETSQEQLLELIEELNHTDHIHGVLVQLPLPEHIDERTVIQAIKPEKDVDGFHPVNVGNLHIGAPGFVPCTPRGIIEMLDRTGIPIKGKHAVVVGRSNIAGKPAAMLLLARHATVTICHSRTVDLAYHTRQADILVVAVGRPRFITGDMIKEGAVVIDVGVNRVDEGLVGDVDFDSCLEKASYITPVPGGVGRMTVVMLMKNTVEAVR